MSPHDSFQMRLRNITKVYEKKKKGEFYVALDNVNLDIYPNEFICIVGPSGSGKSSLLNILASLSQPSSGEIILQKNVVHEPSPDRSFVFQEAGLFPWLNVFENVAFGLKLAKKSQSEIKEKVSAALEQVGLTKFSDAYVHHLSGGMKQRVAIARAFVMDPKVLLMDEPFGALDAQTRDTLHGELQNLWLKNKKTIVFVTHNVREAACLADRIILLSSSPGRIVKEYKVDLPRVRTLEDPRVMAIAHEVLLDLKGLRLCAA